MAAAVSGEVEASTLVSEKPTDEVVPAEETKAEEPVEEPVKEKKSKVTKEKKPKKAKGGSHASHPPYFQMIKEALLALKDNSGSSAYAIAKFMEEKHRAVLPANFKKILWLQLKNCTAKGKLIKIKASFKLSELGKKGAAAKTTSTASKPVSKPRAAKTTPPKKPEGAAKGTGKKVTGKRSRRSAPAKPKQPKSIKSPAAKKAKKVAG